MLEKINKDIAESLKRGDKVAGEALRFLKSVLINARINTGHELSEEEAIQIIRKEIKLRIEARDTYAANQRPELAAKEEYERGLYSLYVPEELTEYKILEIIAKIAITIDEPIDFAKLMPAVMKEISGKADGKTVAGLVKSYLEGNKK
jgi:uncharacterized protein